MSIYIFDLDGTLALIEHRRHLVSGPDKDWPAFFAACFNDQPNEPIITLSRMLYSTSQVWVWSGRSDTVRELTQQWLWQHGVRYDQLRMRKAGDHRPDEVVKAEWLDGLPQNQRSQIQAVFEDRNRMVALWRSRGLACLQVAPGDF